MKIMGGLEGFALHIKKIREGFKGRERTLSLGFSIIELSVVLTIVTFFTLLSVGSLSYLDRINVRCAAELLLADIAYVQQRACITRLPQTLDLQTYRLPVSVHCSKCTFLHQRITAAATGVLCAGTVYLTHDKTCCTYAVTIPVGGAAPAVRLIV